MNSRLPAVYGFRELVPEGALMSLSADLSDIAARGPLYVDKILKGAKPGDLPIELPTKFALVHQPQDRQGPWPDDPAVAPAAGGSGDRVAARSIVWRDELTSFTRSLGILAALVGLVCWLNDWWLGAAAAAVLVVACVVAVLLSANTR
jgi:hypothetical protein